jgi:Na+/H+-dicarboxylate symporter
MHKKNSLTIHILIGLVLGALVGIVTSYLPEGSLRDVWLIEGIFELVGSMFINAIKLLVIPLVFISLVCGVSALGDITRLGRIGGKTMAFYLISTSIAIALALIVAQQIKPGSGLDMTKLVEQQPSINAPQSLVKTLQKIVPENPFMAMAEGNMLQIIFMALLVGIAATMSGEAAKPVLDIFESANEVIMKMVVIIMYFAPYGVFALIAKTFATVGFDAMLPLIKYTITVLLVLLLHITVVYMLALRGLGKLDPIKFFKNFLPAMSVGFSTASSSATLPITIETVEKRCGVSKSVASFTLPLGATINMDGTAIMQGVAVVFIAQVYQIDLTLGSFLTVILTATLASIGTAGVPGVGLITLAMVLESINLPVEGIALIIGIDRLLDMSRTAVNISGDAVCTLLVAKSEKEFDLEIYESDNTDD